MADSFKRFTPLVNRPGVWQRAAPVVVSPPTPLQLRQAQQLVRLALVQVRTLAALQQLTQNQADEAEQHLLRLLAELEHALTSLPATHATPTQ